MSATARKAGWIALWKSSATGERVVIDGGSPIRAIIDRAEGRPTDNRRPDFEQRSGPRLEVLLDDVAGVPPPVGAIVVDTYGNEHRVDKIAHITDITAVCDLIRE